MQSVSKWQCDKGDWSGEKRKFFDFIWLPCQRPLRNQKEVEIGHLQTNTYHLAQRLQKSVQCILI